MSAKDMVGRGGGNLETVQPEFLASDLTQHTSSRPAIIMAVGGGKLLLFFWNGSVQFQVFML